VRIFLFAMLGLFLGFGCRSGDKEEPAVEGDTGAVCDEDDFSDVSAAIAAGAFAVAGERVEALHDFETAIQEYMWAERIPNAGVAFVAGDGRLVLRQSYTNHCGGERDDSGALVHAAEMGTPETRYRIGSISKVITATAIVAQSEASDSALSLDDRLIDFIAMEPAADVDEDGVIDTRDPRVEEITLDHLLRHRPGWNCRKSSEPDDVDEPTKSDFAIQDAYARVGTALSLPISVNDIIGYGSGLPLATDPGTEKSYCGFSYTLLGEVLSLTTGRSVTDAVDDLVFSKLDENTFVQGHTLRSEAQPDEPWYHYHSDATAESVMVEGTLAAMPYGGAFNLENRLSAGGWLASGLDLVRLGWAFMRGDLVSDPAGLVDRNVGWAKDLRRREGATGHTGSLEGSHSILFCYAADDPVPAVAGAC
jgi:CubicO group peptidase (beta-lactamase class C family)